MACWSGFAEFVPPPAVDGVKIGNVSDDDST
jgi:hypothetical protein